MESFFTGDVAMLADLPAELKEKLPLEYFFKARIGSRQLEALYKVELVNRTIARFGRIPPTRKDLLADFARARFFNGPPLYDQPVQKTEALWPYHAMRFSPNDKFMISILAGKFTEAINMIYNYSEGYINYRLSSNFIDPVEFSTPIGYEISPVPANQSENVSDNQSRAIADRNWRIDRERDRARMYLFEMSRLYPRFDLSASHPISNKIIKMQFGQPVELDVISHIIGPSGPITRLRNVFQCLPIFPNFDSFIAVRNKLSQMFPNDQGYEIRGARRSHEPLNRVLFTKVIVRRSQLLFHEDRKRFYKFRGEIFDVTKDPLSTNLTYESSEGFIMNGNNTIFDFYRIEGKSRGIEEEDAYIVAFAHLLWRGRYPTISDVHLEGTDPFRRYEFN